MKTVKKTRFPEKLEESVAVKHLKNNKRKLKQQKKTKTGVSRRYECDTIKI